MPQCRTIRHLLRRGLPACVILAFFSLPAAFRAETAAGVAEPTGETVVLPAFLVDGDAAFWTFAKAEGIEILSLLTPTETREFALEFLRAQDAFNSIVPSEFQGKPDRPLTIILWDRRYRDTIPEEKLGQYWPRKSYSRALPNLLISDIGQWTLFCTPRSTLLGKQIRFRLTPQFTKLLLTSRQPAPAPWALDALTSVYESAEAGGERISLKLPRWTHVLRTGPAGLPPLRDFLSDQSCAPDDVERTAFARQLFATWALLPGEASYAGPFWKLVTRTSAEPASEAIFRECFGFGYDEGDKLLLAFLKKKVRSSSSVWLPLRKREHSIVLESPRPEDIARIKGNWMRLAANIVEKDQAGLSQMYRNEGRRSLSRALDKTQPDPELLHVLGLLAYEEKTTEEAREKLERVHCAGKGSPTVGIALSRLRLAAIRGALDAAQLDSVLDPLWQSCRADNPPEEAVALAAEILARSAAPPKQSHMVQLLAWTRLFPRKPALLFGVARTALRHGFRQDARALLQTALQHTTSPELRRQIEGLLTQTDS